MEEGRLNDQEIEDLLAKSAVGYLALARANQPYLVPLNYLYAQGSIYFHCAPAGRKIDYIKANPLVCFHAGETGGLIEGDQPCSHNYSYRSVVVEGTIEEVCASAEKEAVLRKMVVKYAGPAMGEGEMSAKKIDATAVYRIIPATISGRRDS